jgi:integral membrane protein
MDREVKAVAESAHVELQQLKRLELASIAEATTLVLLVCLAVPAKHIFGWPEGSRYLGPIHGIAFLTYMWITLQTVAGGGWRWRDATRLFVVAFIPFAGYFNIQWLRRRAVLTVDIQTGGA